MGSLGPRWQGGVRSLRICERTVLQFRLLASGLDGPKTGSYRGGAMSSGERCASKGRARWAHEGTDQLGSAFHQARAIALGPARTCCHQAYVAPSFASCRTSVPAFPFRRRLKPCWSRSWGNVAPRIR